MCRFGWSALYGTLLGCGQALRVCGLPIIFVSGLCFLIMGFTLAVAWSLILTLTGWREYIQPGMPLRHYRPPPYRFGPLAFRPWHVVLLATLAIAAFAPEVVWTLAGWAETHRRWIVGWATVMVVGLAFGLVNEVVVANERRFATWRNRFDTFFRDRTVA